MLPALIYLQWVFRVWCQHALLGNGGHDWFLAINLVMISVGWTPIQMQGLPPSLGYYSGRGLPLQGTVHVLQRLGNPVFFLPSLCLSEEWGRGTE